MDLTLKLLSKHLDISIDRDDSVVFYYRWTLVFLTCIYGLLTTRSNAFLTIIFLSWRFSLVSFSPLSFLVDMPEDAPAYVYEALALAMLCATVFYCNGPASPTSRGKGKKYVRKPPATSIPAETTPTADDDDALLSTSNLSTRLDANAAVANMVSPGSSDGGDETPKQRARREVREELAKRQEESVMRLKKKTN